MSFDYEMSADPAKAVAAADTVEKKLEHVEDAAASLGKQIEASFSGPALKNAAGEFDATTVAIEGTSSAVHDVDDALAQALAGLKSFDDEAQKTTSSLSLTASEWAKLLQIQAPFNKYETELAALDGLLRKNMITVDEYAQHVAKLNQQLDRAVGKPITETPFTVGQYGPVYNPMKAGAGPAGGTGIDPNEGDSYASALAGKLGPVGDVLESIVSKEAIAAAAIVALGVAVVGLGDSYITVSNNAQRLVSAGGDVDAVLQQQLDQSDKLHGSLNGMIGITAQVRVGTDQLNLSQQQQTNLTREITEAVQLSGHTFDDTAGLMKKLAFAFENGTVGPRELRSIIREYPEIGKLFEDSLHTNQEGLLALGKAGKIGAGDLVAAFDKAGASLDERFSHRVETTSEQWQHFKDSITLSIGSIVESTGVTQLLGDAVHILGDILGGIAGIVGAAIGALRAMGSAVSDLTGGIVSLNTGAAIGFAVGGPLGALAGSVAQNALKALSGGFDDLMSKAKAYQAAQEAASRAIVEHQEAITHAFKAVASMDAAIAQLHKDTDKLTPSIGGANKILDEFANKQNDVQSKLAATKEALQQTATLIDRVASTPGATQTQIDGAKKFYEDQFLSIQRQQEDALAEQTKNLHTYGGVVAEIEGKETTRERKVQDVTAALDAGAISQKQYNEFLAALGLPADQAVGYLAKYSAEIDKVHDKVTGLSGAKLGVDLLNAFGAASPSLTSSITRQLDDANRDAKLSGESYYETQKKIEQTEVDRRRHLEDDITALRSGKLSQDAYNATLLDYNKTVKALQGPKSEEEKLEERLIKQATEFERSIRALDNVFAHHKITLSDYNLELEKLIKNYKGDDLQRVLALEHLSNVKDIAAAEHQDQHNPGSRMNMEAPSYQADTFLAGDTSEDSRILSAEKDIQLSNQAATAAKKYTEALTDLHLALINSNIPQSDQNELLKKLNDEYNDLKTPLEQYNDAVTKQIQLYQAGVFNVDALEHKIGQLKVQFGQATVGEAFAASIHDAAKSSVVSLELVKAGFDDIGKGILDVAITGKQSLSQWFGTTLDGLGAIAAKAATAKLALKIMGTPDDPTSSAVSSAGKLATDALKKKLAASVADEAAATASGVAQGTAAAAPIGTAMTLAGTSAATEMAAAITAGGTAAGAEMAAAIVAAGSVDAISSAAPVAAGAMAGGGVIIGGSGGTDSQARIIHFTPGERVDFTPPGQLPGFMYANAGNGMPIIHVAGPTIQNFYDRREIHGEIGSTATGRRGVLNAVNKQRKAIAKTLKSP